MSQHTSAKKKKSTKRQVLEFFITTTFLISALATILIIVSRFITYPYELVSHFKTHIILIQTTCLALYTALSRKTLALIVFITLLINVIPEIKSITTSNKSIPITEGYDIKIMSINILRTNTEYQKILNEIAKENADIVVLIEYTKKWHTELQNTPALQILYPHQHIEYLLHNGKEDGVAIYSKTPITKVEPLNENNLITVKIKNFHLITGHLSNPIVSKQNQEKRDEQLATIVRKIKKYNIIQEIPTIVIADFNSTQHSYEFKDMISKSGLKNAQTDIIYQPTWSPALTKYTRLIGLTIDHALHTKEIRTKNFKTGNFIGSDHYPIIVNLRIPHQKEIAGD